MDFKFENCRGGVILAAVQFGTVAITKSKLDGGFLNDSAVIYSEQLKKHFSM